MTRWTYLVLVIQFTVSCFVQAQDYDEKNGLLLGSFPAEASAHGVAGRVFAVDENTLRVTNFSYDGKGPDAYFWFSTKSDVPDSTGVVLPHTDNKSAILTAQKEADFILPLPANVVVNDVKYLSVWCKQFNVDFGHVKFPANFQAPRPTDIMTFSSSSAPGVAASRITILDNKRIQIDDFTYDGQAPDAFFMVGTQKVTATNGHVIPNEQGSLDKLSKYEKKTIVLMLPNGMFMSDIDWLSVYCKQADLSLGDVSIPHNVRVPPYIKMGYYGTMIGKLTTYLHGVSGEVFVIDKKRIWLRKFSYDGQGKDVHFVIGKRGEHGITPSNNGIIIPNEKGSTDNLGKYEKQDIVLTLPDGTVTSDVAWLSVLCNMPVDDYGSVLFPRSVIHVPKEEKIGKFTQLAHGVHSGDVFIINKKQIQITNLYYDGKGPDAYFLVGIGNNISAEAAVKIADEQGSFMKLKSYEGQTITLTLPSAMTVDDIDWLSIYCIRFTSNFGDVRLPKTIYHVPPYIEREKTSTLPNCEPMNDYFNVAWKIVRKDIEFEFTGKLDGDNGYMAFGLSGNSQHSNMVGADVMVVYLDNGVPKLSDYSINQRSLCSGGNGVCPDTLQGGSDDLHLISGSVYNGITSVRFRRSLMTSDSISDKTIPSDSGVYVVWAMGNVNSDLMVTKHKKTLENRDMMIEFGRIPAYNCEQIVTADEEKMVTPWKIPMISGKDVKIFRARIGPTGGKRGYEAITGQVSWGIAWYINGYLIPELIVKRGETYMFKVEGGDDPSRQAQYHPLYITDDPKGGYSSKDDESKAKVKLIAGTIRNSTGVYGTDGRFCEYSSDANPLMYDSFEEFSKTLTLKCEDGKPAGHFNWTVSMDTPNLVYYQCFTHSYLGWKINVIDEYPMDNGDVTSSCNHLTLSGHHLAFILTALMAVQYLEI